jgi:hypothetical protein
MNIFVNMHTRSSDISLSRDWLVRTMLTDHNPCCSFESSAYILLPKFDKQKNPLFLVLNACPQASTQYSIRLHTAFLHRERFIYLRKL